MADRQNIMIVDDDPNIAKLIQLLLEKEGFDVTVQERGDDAVAAFQKNPPSLMLLDVMLPAKDDTFDKVLGLELGADDYITKPFENKELVARVKAVLRRTNQNETEKGTLSFPGLTISQDKYEVYFQGNRLDLPPKELEVLYYLASYPNQVFTREQLLEQVWGFDFFGDSRTVDVHIKRLREKLAGSETLGWQIKTVWGVGYKFEVK